ncbi:hypothetical protein D3C81_2060150 [compost metagenome]
MAHRQEVVLLPPQAQHWHLQLGQALGEHPDLQRGVHRQGLFEPDRQARIDYVLGDRLWRGDYVMQQLTKGLAIGLVPLDQGAHAAQPAHLGSP